MFATTPVKKDKPITLKIDRNSVARGHGFVAALSRGGKHQDRRNKRPRTAKTKDW
jgi:hypothetical protein